MSIAGFSVDYRVLVNVLFWLCVALGIVAFQATTVDVYPDVSFDQAQIVVIWPGASPEEIETSITKRIEERIKDVRGIDRIVSSSERDRALIDVKFREDLSEAEFNRDFEELRAQVAKTDDLPDDAEEPDIRKITTHELSPLLQVVVTSDDGRAPLATLREVARRARDKLRRIDGVLRVSDVGIPEPEWRISVRRNDLESAGLELLGVADRLRALHRDVPAGSLDAGDAAITISAAGEFQTPEALLDAVVGYRRDASPVRLREIADVGDGFEKLRSLNRYNGRPSVTMAVIKRTDGDSLAIRKDVGAVIERFEAEEALPPGVHLAVTIDTTKILEGRIKVLRDNLSSGIVLVFLILWAFLGLRNSALAVIGIPFSFLLAFALLSLIGVTINAITLFAFLLVSGMVVDDALVVLENIHRRVTSGWPLARAVVTGTMEVAWPVFSACLTTVAAFIPMLIMGGVVGEFMSIIPKTVVAVLLASLIECLLMLPAHYMHVGERAGPRGFVLAVNRGFGRIGAVYGKVLERTLRHPSLVVVACLVLAGGAAVAWRKLPVELFPSDFQAFFCNITVDPEYSLEQTSEATREVERLLDAMMPDRIDSYTTHVGVVFTDDLQIVMKPNVAQLLVYASDAWTAEHDSQELIREIRKRTDELVQGKAQHRFVRIRVDTFQDGPPVGKPVAVRVAAPDYDIGKAAAREVADALRATPGVTSIADNLDEGPREVRLVPEPLRLAEQGIPFAEAGRLLYAANEGIEVGKVVPDGRDEEVTLRVSLREEDRRVPEDLLRLGLRTPLGATVPLREVVTATVRRGPASLYHYDGDRVVLVTADVDKEMTDSRTVNQRLMRDLRDLERRFPGVAVEYGGEFAETQKSFDSLARAFVIAIVLIYAILAAQFKSYVVPAVVMTVVPFSYIGVIFGLLLLGHPFTIMTFIAIVGLSGVVVNDSIVLVEFIEEARRSGTDLVPAILEGCRVRLRPIFLTTATTVLGLFPMALGITGYSKIWSPFAATISFGLSLAMILTLFLIPAVYVLVDRRRKHGHPGSGSAG